MFEILMVVLFGLAILGALWALYLLLWVTTKNDRPVIVYAAQKARVRYLAAVPNGIRSALLSIWRLTAGKVRENAGHMRETIWTIWYVSLRLQRIFFRVARRAATLLPILILISTAIFYLRFRFIGYVVDSGTLGSAYFWIGVTVAAMLVQLVLQELIEVYKYLAEHEIEKEFSTFVPGFRILFGMACFQKGDERNAMLKRADSGVYGLKFVPAQQITMVASALTAVWGLMIVLLHAPLLGLVLAIAAMLVILLRVNAASDLARTDKGLWFLKSERTDVGNALRYKDYLKAALLLHVAPQLKDHLKELATQVSDKLVYTRFRNMPKDILAVAVETGAIGFALYVLVPGMISGEMTKGELIYLSTTIGSLFVTLEGVVRVLGRQALGMNEVKDTLEYRETKLTPELTAQDDGEIAELPEEAPNLVIDGLSFGYVPEKLVLKDVSVKFPAGQITIVDGDNGAGKTTLFDLISKLYPAPLGAIFIETKDLATLETNLVRNYAMHFGQHPLTVRLTPRTLLSFAAGFAPPDTEAEKLRQEQFMWRALDLATLGGKVRAMRRGLDEPLSSNRDAEVDLSGGQMKKLNLAMFFIAVLEGRTRIAIFDEPLVGIDPTSGYQIMENIAALGITIIVSTHSVEYVPDEAWVVFFNRASEGAPATVHQGTHGELRRSLPDYDRYCAGGKKWPIAGGANNRLLANGNGFVSGSDLVMAKVPADSNGQGASP